MGRSLPRFSARQRDRPVPRRLRSERAKHFHQHRSYTLELPHQNVVHGVQGLQVRAEYDERDPRDRPLHADGVGDDTSGRMWGEGVHRQQGSARQGLLHVCLQLCSEREL